MTVRRSRRDKLDQNEMADVDLRKSVFREMARDLSLSIRERNVTDVPGSIAKLMEAAFRAGAEAAKNDKGFSATDRLHRRMTIMDLPTASRDSVQWMKYAICGVSDFLNYPCPPRPAALILVNYPGLGVWRQASKGSVQEHSNRVIQPLIKLGLIKVMDGRIAHLTQWGYELIMTGETSLPDDRDKAPQITREWGSLMADEPLQKSFEALGIKVITNEAEATPGPR